MTAEAEIADELPTALYRLYADDGTLLYIGVTGDLRTRFGQHSATKSWWPDVARKTIAWHGTRLSALTAETEAIGAEAPLYNLQEMRTKAAVRGTRAGDRHKSRLLGWYPPVDLAEWIRAEAGREGVRLSDLLTEALEEYRARRT